MAGWGWDVIKHIWTKWGHPGWPLGPIMAHFRANNGYFHHISTIYWCYLDGVVTVTSPEHPGWYRIPYNKFWQGLVIQAGQWDQLWVISEPKMVTEPNYGSYQHFPEVILIVLQLSHAQSMEGWGWDAIQHIFTKGGHPGRPLGPIMGLFSAKNSNFSLYINHLLKLSWLCCNCDNTRAQKAGIRYHTTYFDKVGLSRLATRPIYGPFWSQKWQFFIYL